MTIKQAHVNQVQKDKIVEMEMLHQRRMRRIVSEGPFPMIKAEQQYVKTGRPNLGSYLAELNGRWVRVDGSDPDDVAFYKHLGFVAMTAPIKQVR